MEKKTTQFAILQKRWYGFILLMLLQLVFLPRVHAQDLKVTGVVRDAKANPIQGVSVNVKGTTVGTTTDANGMFTINVFDQKSVLVFSNVGYLNKEEVVGARSAINVGLNESASDLEGVVVIGYGGTTKKRDVTGSTASVSSKQIQERVPVTLFDALQGQAAGILITNDNGDPMGQGNIQIRGASTINTEGNGPLYVIDGVLSENANFINPNDIETIDILKGASSAAIYGARGANSVILITTKAVDDPKNAFNGVYA